MKRLCAVLAVLGLSVACGGDSPTAPVVARVTPTPVVVATATATPAPTPRTLVGFWKDSGGYGILIDSDDGFNIRGRSVFTTRNLTGLLVGTVKPNGRVEWRTEFIPGISENGSFDLDASRRSMSGSIFLEVERDRYEYRGTLVREP